MPTFIGLDWYSRMENIKNPNLDAIFEQIQSEIDTGERDDAALLQAIALSSDNPNEIRKHYLLIRAKKIHKTNILEKIRGVRGTKNRVTAIIFLGFLFLAIVFLLFLFP